MEIIDWVEHEEKGGWNRPNLVAFALIEAMSDKAGDDVEKVFTPFEPKALKVEFKINGVDVSFVHVMNIIQEHVYGLEDEIKKSIIKDAGEKLIEELRNKIEEW